jgi:hypothetical protein
LSRQIVSTNDCILTGEFYWRIFIGDNRSHSKSRLTMGVSTEDAFAQPIRSVKGHRDIIHMIPETEKMSDMSSFDSGASEHQIIFKQWRLGFLVFYGAIASLLGGFALVADRPGTFISVAAPTNPTMASTNTMRHANEGRVRE